MPKHKVVKVRDYNKGIYQVQNYNIDKLRLCAVSYNLEGAKFSRIQNFFTKLISTKNLDTSHIDVLIVGLQEVKHTIKTKELHKLQELSSFKHITILGGKGILRGSTRLLIFSKYKLNIEPAIDNIKNTFKTIKNIIIADISLSLEQKKVGEQKQEQKQEQQQNAIQFSVLNCHLPKDTLSTYITDDKLSKLKFKNNIILGDFNSRTEFVYTSKTTGQKVNKTKKAPLTLTEKTKYNSKYNAILKQLESKSLKDILNSKTNPNKQNKGEPEFTDTLYKYKHKKGKLKDYRELQNLSGNSNPTELPQNPTYKINPKTGQYVYFKKEKRTKKLRVPSYADRILVTGNDIIIETYKTLTSIKLSDHLPIMGIYTVKKDTYKYPVNTTTGTYDGIGLLSTYNGEEMVSGMGNDLGAVSVANVGVGANVVDVVSESNNNNKPNMGIVSEVGRGVIPNHNEDLRHNNTSPKTKPQSKKPTHTEEHTPKRVIGVHRNQPQQYKPIGLPRQPETPKSRELLPNVIPQKTPYILTNNIPIRVIEESIHSEPIESMPKQENPQPVYDFAIKETEPVYELARQEKIPDYELARLESNRGTEYETVKPETEQFNKGIQTSFKNEKTKPGIDMNVGTTPPPSTNSKGVQVKPGNAEFGVGTTPPPSTKSSQNSSNESGAATNTSSFVINPSSPSLSPSPSPSLTNGNNKGPDLRPNMLGITPGDKQNVKIVVGRKNQKPKQIKEETELDKRLREQREKIEADMKRDVINAFKTTKRRKTITPKNKKQFINIINAVIESELVQNAIKANRKNEVKKVREKLIAIAKNKELKQEEFQKKIQAFANKLNQQYGGTKKRNSIKHIISKRKTKKRKNKNKTKTN
jgi:hypothetical protein